jgi:hypothetical protein
MSHLDEPGGTPGGIGLFLSGAVLSFVSVYFFVDSVRVTTFGRGIVSGGFGGWGGTGSAAIVFLPLLVAVIALFYDASKRWAWGLFGLGIFILMAEILSRLEFFINLKLSHLLIMLVSFGAGIGLILRSLRAQPS